jgi:putative tRNA adenosine deaminase-associated protein
MPTDDEVYDLADRGDDRPGFEDIEPLDGDDDDADDLVDDEDDFDDLDDATADDVDFVIALYREDGTPVAQALDPELANDFDELITQLQRLPGDAGALGMVSVAGEFFVAARVRGQHVQVILSDVYAAEAWSLARDVVDYLNIEIPEDDDEDGLVGDLEMLADLGLPEMELDLLCSDLDQDSDAIALTVADHIHFGPPARKAAASFD